MEDPVEFRPPTGDLPLVIARSKKLNDFMPLGHFLDLLLYFLHDPAIENGVGESTRSVHRWMNSHLQPVYRIAHGLAEVVQFLSICSSSEGITDTSTEYPEVYAILIIGHLVLAGYGLGTSHRGREGSLPGS